MTEQSQQFRVVLRGYDTTQVDQRLAELAQAASEARAGADELAQRVRVLEAERERAAARSEEAEESDTPATPLTFDHLGPRVVQILTLAEEEAEDLKARATAEIEAHRRQLDDDVTRLRKDADTYAAQRRSDADTESARVLEDARRTADDRLDAAERDAAARLQEAEAVYEDAAGQGRPGRRRLRDHPGHPPAVRRAGLHRADAGAPAPPRRARGAHRAHPHGRREDPRRVAAREPPDHRGGRAAGVVDRHRRTLRRRPGAGRVRARARRRQPAPRQHQRPARQRPPDAGHPHGRYGGRVARGACPRRAGRARGGRGRGAGQRPRPTPRSRPTSSTRRSRARSTPGRPSRRPGEPRARHGVSRGPRAPAERAPVGTLDGPGGRAYVAEVSLHRFTVIHPALSGSSKGQSANGTA